MPELRYFLIVTESITLINLVAVLNVPANASIRWDTFLHFSLIAQNFKLFLLPLFLFSLFLFFIGKFARPLFWSSMHVRVVFGVLICVLVNERIEICVVVWENVFTWFYEIIFLCRRLFSWFLWLLSWQWSQRRRLIMLNFLKLRRSELRGWRTHFRYLNLFNNVKVREFIFYVLIINLFYLLSLPFTIFAFESKFLD